MRLLAASFSLFLLSTPALADKVFDLREDENVSRLLYDRLKIEPIYKNGLLKEILDYNQLSIESAKKLPVGTPIKIPAHIEIPTQSIAIEPETTPVVTSPELPSEEPSEEPVETPVEVVTESAPLNLIKWVGIGAKPAILSGEGKETETSYAMLLLKGSLEGGIGSKTDRHELLFSVNGDFAYLQKDDALDGSNSLFLAETNFTYRYLVSSVWLGLHLNYGQRMVFIPKTDKKYELRTPWLYGIGPTLAWNNFTASYLLYPEQSVKSDVKTEMNQSFILTYEFIKNNRGWKFSGALLQNSTEDIDGQQIEFGARYLWYF